MADITMCRGTGCKMKESCYRFNAKTEEYQWYFQNPPCIEDGTKCEMYWGDQSEGIFNQLKSILK